MEELQLHFGIYSICGDGAPLLFDCCAVDEEKEQIAETLLQGKGHHAAVSKKRKGDGKPKFPEEVNGEPSLADLT